MQLNSRKVLITGGGSGLGLACADAVSRAGGTPIVLDRDISDAGDHRAHEVDVTDRAALEKVITEVAEDLGGLDAIVAAAGLDTPGELDEISAEQWEHVLAVNLLGTVSAVRAALPYLKRSHGRVITVSSTLALKGAGGATAYSASKFGVRGFSQALAAELKGEVGVTNLIPGGMKTKFFDGRTEQYMPQDDSRLNEPARVAESIVYALTQPENVEIRELLIANELEDSWP
ncbi:SDR family oxidoreductase [Corynebacterium halotolerans]|uniref:Short-chain alcohol dehydrogenase n=1 Tax=Corynebacterium halotolerans YIM 70093 = DSM 44683 TaxID=1121362 RepID=M1P636_9CORY|nr:SDR family oxidoreductase [Corynebacterium halotolerans]AGF72106.1 short-chain alcohol dehydrogenase [Corynebacterium halotolerans YIM 70093 = DSM 44683]